MVEVRKIIKDEDYEDIRSWWIHYGEKFVPQSLLPSIGAVSYDKDQKIASSWLYKDSMARAGWLTWVCVNPKASKDVRGDGITLAIKECLKIANSIGLMFVWTATAHVPLQKRFEKMGFRLANSNAQEMILSLEEGLKWD